MSRRNEVLFWNDQDMLFLVRHKWLLTLVGTALMQIGVWLYSVGQLHQMVFDMKAEFQTEISVIQNQINVLIQKIN